jgi:hypothetical protein
VYKVVQECNILVGAKTMLFLLNRYSKWGTIQGKPFICIGLLIEATFWHGIRNLAVKISKNQCLKS